MFNHTSEHPIFIRIMLAVIILSFCLWGIGDIFRAGGGPGTVAKVGKASISMREYQNALRNRQDELRDKLGKNYTPEFAKKLGLEKHALDGIINRLLLEQEAASLGIVASEDDVMDYIARSPEFHDQQGQFSKEQYMNVLQSNHRSEADFIASIRSQLATQLLIGTVAGNMPVHEELVYAVYLSRFEKRSAGIITIPANVAAAVQPAEKDIKAYYDTHGDQFLVPEYRSFSYIELKQDDLRSTIHVSDAEVQKAYTDRADEFQQPERRVIEQLVFAKKDEADKAEAALAAGKSFAQVASSLPALNKDKLLLGELTKAAVPVNADAVFALKEGEYSKPAESPFGWHIMRVDKILPSGPRPLADVREQIVKDISSKAAEDASAKLSNDFEDAMGGGATLQDAAKKLGVQVHSVTSMTRDGLTLDGSKPDLPTYSDFMEIAFATPDKEHSRMVPADNGVTYMIRVDSVTAEHPKPLAEILPQVVQAVKKEQAGTQARIVAEQLAKDLKAGKTPEAALAGKAVSPVFETAGGLTRGHEAVTEGKLAGKSLPAGLIAELFKAKTGSFTGAYEAADGSFMVGKLETVTRAPDITAQGKDAAQLKPIREELIESLERQTKYDYFEFLRQKYPVTFTGAAASLPADNDEE